ncbi:Uma2 family endonuclease [Chroococcidiopsis sp. FACHB-1243]|uniref:Uma2 family endonuclease n=1 Tax=Chroococcidiopsis sp. [FACHB-1243] TaxID=2692781 RepID=UPI00177BE0AB|nr:Uma2 family endonuclease [Chroococcidiopsis sp. [FACHB-1243]]MBD2304643.1 Uma2 family endonuclease [Chroococcidiopsis sp. [FACHB-1243]]
MVLLNDLTQRLQADDPEEKRIVTGVSWHHYEALVADLGDNSGYRVAYLDGVLEIVSPSRRHEKGKTRIGDLLLIYFLETDTEYFPTGSTTFRKEESQAGAEPDESYCIATEKDFPDLAIEVVVTGGGINKLELYRRLGVREVWFWQNENFYLYYLREETPDRFQQNFGYERIERSEILPNLDISLLAECLSNSNPLAAAKDFRQRLRSQFGQN